MPTARPEVQIPVGERGASAVELMVVLALAAILLATSVGYSVQSIGREEVRSAAHEIQTTMQIARSEAVKRNRQCRFTVNTATRVIRAVDLMGTPSTTSDDVILQSATLPSRIKFLRPGGGTAVTLTVVSGTTYGLDFTSQGVVSGSTGTISLKGGDRYDQVMAMPGGATRIDRWNGSAWANGS